MENTKTVIHTRKSGTRPALIREAEAKADPKGVSVWTLEHAECTNRTEIDLGRQVAAAGLIAANGTYDRETMLLFKGLALATLLIKGWDRKTADDQPLAVTAENIETLPKPVLIEFGMRMLFGTAVTAEEEAEEEKKG